jgi:hypothetical protein
MLAALHGALPSDFSGWLILRPLPFSSLRWANAIRRGRRILGTPTRARGSDHEQRTNDAIPRGCSVISRNFIVWEKEIEQRGFTATKVAPQVYKPQGLTISFFWRMPL